MLTATRIACVLALLLSTGGATAGAQLVRATPDAGVMKPLVPGLFSEICNNGEVLIGLFGKAGAVIDRVGGYCVKVRSNGTWNGEVRTTDVFGGWGGTQYDLKCSRDHAISGFKGREGLLVDRIQIQCRKLASPTSQTGAASGKL